ncbi:crossover junction endonuclease MUS81 [Elysia marginata]|uniref:Crossover junction endonuclease MUS81 n=1 Tax=Elysia marginata TaxID=1093978 RepID=A0AAV4EZA3_9GAST|nr:crossover junction endonuclease MUS81 [Elysia marginata]
MDDLVSSLTDGRMKEQKFRLKHCGLSETIILIEEYGSVQNFSLSEDRIKQSIVNSQMIDGFKVKRCGSTKDAVSYLAIMTRFLQQSLCSKTLHGVPVDQMKLLKGQQTLDDSKQYLAPFNAFNEAAIKHKDLNVTELFAKQLIQVPGISADKAKAIINVYPTLSSLMDAYQNCSNVKDSEKLLATIKFGKNERNLGIAVSRMLHMLYTQQDSLP